MCVHNHPGSHSDWSHRKIHSSWLGDKSGCWGHNAIMQHLMAWTRLSSSLSLCAAHHCMTNSLCCWRRVDRPSSEPCVCSGSTSFLVFRKPQPHLWLCLVQPWRKKSSIYRIDSPPWTPQMCNFFHNVDKQHWRVTAGRYRCDCSVLIT